MGQSRFVLALIALLATGCTAVTPTSPSGNATSPAEGTSLPSPSPPLDVLIPGAEGLVLHATWRAGGAGKAPAVLLLPMFGGRRQDWEGLAEALQSAGMATLALDLRGQGDTGGKENWTLAVEDVASAHAWLAARQDVDAERRGTVGASIGANLALAHAAHDPSVRAIALLSPGLDYFRVTIEGLMSLYGNRPILLVASEKDGYSSETVQTLANEATGEASLVVFPGEAHGTQLFFTQASLVDTLVEFLRSHLED